MISRTPDWTTARAAVTVAVPALYRASMWLGYDEAWIHPEQVRAAVYIWTPSTEGYGQLLRNSFDRSALDTSDAVSRSVAVLPFFAASPGQSRFSGWRIQAGRVGSGSAQ